MAATNAAKNRAIRQEALREQLSKQKHIEQVVKNIIKMEQQSASMEATELQAIRAATETRLKLVNKYLPDLKSTEFTGEGGGAIAIAEVVRTIVDPTNSDS
jgi:hypothetical protein